ncbi:MAG TPA: HEAT repeat domain-containing protein [Gemmatimonadales bacterium]|nr:HEAT repeat domain-containing protein [Gemmatimonadales bacterium]
MTDSAATLSALAKVVFLLRDKPEAQEEQRAAFREFAEGLDARDLTVTLTERGFLVGSDEVPFGSVPIDALHRQLAAIGVGGFRLPAGLTRPALLTLFRAISVPPGTYGSFDHLMARLDAAGSGAVQVSPIDQDLAKKPRDPKAKEDDGTLEELGPDALSEAQVGLMHFATLQPHSINPVQDTVTRLESEKSSQGTSDLLNELVASAELAVRQKEWPTLLRAAHSLIQLESKGGDRAEHRGYGIALRRMLPRSALERLARMVSSGPHRTEAVAVMRRMGADATEVLLHEMATAEDASDRRAYFNALKEMTEGTNLVVHMLSHDDWFVVRNVADLAGELRIENAVPQLAKQVDHADERVRKAVAGALAKIGGSPAAEALRHALKDSSPGVRLQAVANLDGRKTQGLAASLAIAAEDESKPDVQREMYLALGRIGSQDAIAALQKAAEPGRRLFRRKSTAARLAAIEGLHLAGPSAANAIKGFLEDEDPEVRAAAEKALSTMWQ